MKCYELSEERLETLVQGAHAHYTKRLQEEENAAAEARRAKKEEELQEAIRKRREASSVARKAAARIQDIQDSRKKIEMKRRKPNARCALLNSKQKRSETL